MSLSLALSFFNSALLQKNHNDGFNDSFPVLSHDCLLFIHLFILSLTHSIDVAKHLLCARHCPRHWDTTANCFLSPKAQVRWKEQRSGAFCVPRLDCSGGGGGDGGSE